MAEKRYYWLKLKEDFFKDKKIKKLRKIAGGDTYTIIYLKIQLLSLKNNGILIFEGVENTLEEELALELDEEVENVKITIAYLKANELLYETDNSNEFALPETMSSIGSESESAERVRRLRSKNKQAVVKIEAKTSTERSQSFRAKQETIEKGNIPLIEDYINKKRYNGNYYLVLKRDNYECCLCGNKDNLCVHHIDGYDENKPENSNLNKMLVLCRECHSQVHNGLGLPNEILDEIGYFCNGNEICNGNVTLDIDKDKEKEIELDKDKDLDKENIKKEKVNGCLVDNEKMLKQGSEKQYLENLGVEFLGVEVQGVENQGQLNTNNKILNNKNTNNQVINEEITYKENIQKENLFSIVVESDEPSDLVDIFNYWNTKDIIKHRDINSDIEKAIKKALKEHTVAEIKMAIDRYAYVYHDENYYFKHRWSLDQFLKQGNAYKDFLDNGSKWENYVNSKAGQKAVENMIMSEYYDPHFLDNIDMEKVERELSK